MSKENNIKKPLCINVECDNTIASYSFVSNLLNKITLSMELSKSDLNNVTYFPAPQNDCKGYLRSIALDYYRYSRTEIKKYDIFANTLQNYELGVILHINYTENGISDITDLLNMLLIKHFYDSLNLHIVITGERHYYFKISQYLAFISQDDTFYNCIYYYDDEKIAKPLQRNGIGALHDYIPAVFIESKDFIGTYFSPINESFFAKIEKNIKSRKFDIYAGCAANLKTLCKNIKRMQMSLRDILIIFRNKTFFCFLLFCYTVNGADFTSVSTKEELLKILDNYSNRLERYASCVKQLVENVLFHSAKKEGVLSIRCFWGNKHKLFLKKIYGAEFFEKNSDTSSFCEITISDYSGNIDNGNIAENFRRNLDAKYKEQFKDLKPASFFVTASDGEAAKAWGEYYSEAENFSRHFGLKIFKSLVERCNGIFHMETHSNHCNCDGDHYTTVKDGILNYSKNVLPGTTFKILLLNDWKSTYESKDIVDVSLVSDLTKSWSRYLKCKTKPITFDLDYSEVNSKFKKGELITKTIKVLSKHVDILNSGVAFYQCNAQKLKFCAAEIICKALLIFIRDIGIQNSTNFIFYNCKDNSFRSSFIDTINAFWDKNVMGVVNSLCQIALFNDDNSRYTVLIPDSREQTILLNSYISKTKAIYPENFFNSVDTSAEQLDVNIIPFEMICTPFGNECTVFEEYTRNILNNNVQDKGLGCKIQDTHMRLGSSIHIDDFYEAEILFSNKLFVSGFAFLLAKRILDLNDKSDVILYGYASYSEMLLYNVKYMLTSASDLNVECMFLEREAEHRGIVQMDIIRKNISNEGLNSSSIYFIVPINSTMKTLSKMYDTLTDINELSKKRKYHAFAVITIAPERENQYWANEASGRSIKPKNNLTEYFEMIDYFVTAKTNYYEATQCKLCYPVNLLCEKPLIEVNASSTIPYQSFKLFKFNNNSHNIIDYDEFANQVGAVERLRSSLVYGHTRRGENHFWYYIRTEKFMRENRDDIEVWLKEKANKIVTADGNLNIFNIIFCPMHFSNVDFMEAVNNCVFSGAAMVIRVDVDKEYRSNFTAKYSNLSNLMTNLDNKGEKYSIRFHYVDDTIITGRTLNRAKSLANTLFKKSTDKVRIFDTIIILLNRNSEDSTRLFLSHFEDVDTKIYSFMNLRISSLRTHGNSCVLCNLDNDAKRLSKYSASQEMAEYWDNRAINGFGVKDIQISYTTDSHDDSSSEKNYRRLLCSHLLGYFLGKLNAFSGKREAMNAIIIIINIHLRYAKKTDSRDDSLRELFYSYLKVLTRPFIFFDKFVRESAFDLLLVLIESLLTGSSVSTSFEKMCANLNDETYPKFIDNKVIDGFMEMLGLAGVDLSAYNPELLKILMKQLSEMKSNYIIRCSGMNKIINYVNNNDREGNDFLMYYARIAKRLICVSSDTSKSVWLDYLLIFGHEINDDSDGEDRESLVGSENMNKLVQLLLLENTKVYYDAVDQLSGISGLEYKYTGDTYVRSSIEKIRCFINMDHTAEESSSLIKELSGNSIIKNFLTSLTNHHEICETEKLKHILQRLETLEDGKFGDDSINQKNMDLIFEQLRSGDFIFANFRKIREYLLNKISNLSNQESHNNEVDRMIMSSVLLLRHINHAFSSNDISESSNDHLANSSTNVNEQFNTFARIIKDLLNAMSTSIIFMTKSAVNAWEGELIEAAGKRGVDISDVLGNVHRNSEFIVLSSSESTSRELGDDNDYYPEGLRNDMDDYADKCGGMDYFISNKYFIWKIETDKLFPVYIYAEFSGKDNLRYIRIKFLMMMRHKLRQKIFGREVNQYLHELVKERNELVIQRREKTHTHTIRANQWYYFQKSVQTSADEMNNSALILLSDLAISEAYRLSLTKEYYIPYECVRPFKAVKWGECYQGNCMEIDLDFGSYKKVKLILKKDVTVEDSIITSCNDSWLTEDDELISSEDSENYHKHFLFLIALAQNSIKNITDPDKAMQVYVTKTVDNCIRLCHKIDGCESVNIEQMRSSMYNPPSMRDGGITMWSVTSYIKVIVIHMAFHYVLNSEKFDMTLLKRLLSNEYHPNVEVLNLGNEAYLSIKLPMLMNKYRCFFEKGREE